MINPRILRLAASSLLILAVGAVLGPRATNYVSTSAVVNAPTVLVSAPFHGSVKTAPDLTSILRAGDLIVEMEPSVDFVRERAELDAMRGARGRQIEALDEQSAALRALLSAETERRSRHIDMSLQKQDAYIAEARAEIAAAEAVLSEAKDRARRSGLLAERGQVSKALALSDSADSDAAREHVTRLKAQLTALEIERNTLREGVILSTDNADHDGRIHEITLRLAELASQRAQLAADREALDARLTSLENRTFPPRASTNGVVQSIKVRSGDSIGQGEQILSMIDCDRRFLEVAVSERHFESIRPGDKASIFLRGSPAPFSAAVTAVRGAGAKPDYPELAAEPPQVPEGQLRVIIALEPAELSGPEGAKNAGGFCGVGRTAEVRFDRSFLDDLRLFGLDIPAVWAAFAPSGVTTAEAQTPPRRQTATP